MANVMPQAPIPFVPRPVKDAPSPFGFGFGLGNAGPHIPHLQSTFHPASSVMQPTQRAQKRRHDPDEEAYDENRYVRDESMDRSPTPERPTDRTRRAMPKRARVAQPMDIPSKGDKREKGGKQGSGDENDIDVGVLLASLPTQSLLPLLNSIVAAQPSLKPLVLSLIPRPTLETAAQALAQSAKKLRDAYPYSNTPSFASGTSSFSTTSSSFGSTAGSSSSFSHGFGGNRLNTSPRFGSYVPQTSSFGPSGQTAHAHGGMRDDYVLSRLRPHINEFVSACLSYLPYFSYVPRPASDASLSDSQSPSSAPYSAHKDRPTPGETFTFLCCLMNHILSQPPLAQSALAPQLLPRLVEEWKAWVNYLDQHVNQGRGIFGAEMVRGWERGLDGFAEVSGNGMEVMREVRDQWVAKVGWLIGKSQHHPMED